MSLYWLSKEFPAPCQAWSWMPFKWLSVQSCISLLSQVTYVLPWQHIVLGWEKKGWVPSLWDNNNIYVIFLTAVLYNNIPFVFHSCTISTSECSINKNIFPTVQASYTGTLAESTTANHWVWGHTCWLHIYIEAFKKNVFLLMASNLQPVQMQPPSHNAFAGGQDQA